MAIKVNGTTVINDSRQLQNVASVDATTVAALGAAGVGGGHWENLSEVTLGGSVVSAVDITLPTGYDYHKVEFNFPMPDGGSYKEPRMRLLNSGGTAQDANWAVFYSYNNGNRSQQNNSSIQLIPYTGGYSVSYFFGTITIRDARSTSHKTSFQASDMGAYTSFFAERMTGTTTGMLEGTTEVTTLRLEYDGTANIGTGSGFYYRLYGHTYS